MAKRERRSLMIPDELYQEARQAALRESLSTGENITLAEFIRRAIAERVEREGKRERQKEKVS